MSYLPWIKLYTDIIANPKLYQLSEPRRWRFVQLLALAGECDAQGYLVISGFPLTPDYLAWRLLVNLETMQKDLQALANLGLVAWDEAHKAWLIPSFAQKQNRPSETQKEKWRFQKQRQRRSAQSPTQVEIEDYAPDEPGEADLFADLEDPEQESSNYEQAICLVAQEAREPSIEDNHENSAGVRAEDTLKVFQRNVHPKRRLEENKREKRQTKSRAAEKQRPPPSGRLKTFSPSTPSVFDEVAQELGLRNFTRENRQEDKNG